MITCVIKSFEGVLFLFKEITVRFTRYGLSIYRIYDRLPVQKLRNFLCKKFPIFFEEVKYLLNL
ncbi:hypothetical protein LEP1GSC062_3904 [Leptospira alexanderi serovar Manhao 3 str. L 60]|uniref:Uncharacterized protein n=1 Tax=Leptospira alexanderi serovar Manhao 3 str. L 60 TaxID=1049759 RepID=V6I0G4_9LEPT|nr:hypothetical protein LEP1GSC062_3904 [Leptospira alexanderi serovar Manhao 3 str. L 60]